MCIDKKRKWIQLWHSLPVCQWNNMSNLFGEKSSLYNLRTVGNFNKLSKQCPQDVSMIHNLLLTHPHYFPLQLHIFLQKGSGNVINPPMRCIIKTHNNMWLTSFRRSTIDNPVDYGFTSDPPLNAMLVLNNDTFLCS